MCPPDSKIKYSVFYVYCVLFYLYFLCSRKEKLCYSQTIKILYSVFTEHPKSNVPKGSIVDQIKVNSGFLQVR